MARLRTVAATVSLVEGAWGLVLAFGGGALSEIPRSTGWSETALAAIVIVLVIDSLVCVVGLAWAFYVSALLSVVALPFIPGGPGLGALFLGSLLLALVTVILDVVAARRKEFISEQNHPLNLPVFG